MTVRILTRSLFFLTALVLITACGKEELGEDSLRISVQIPGEERPELFWFGVERKELEIRRGEESKTYPWVTGQEVEMKLSEGDSLVFRAYDREGRLLVLGEAEVGNTKNISIPLRRVL